jgi:hypothetical protein
MYSEELAIKIKEKVDKSKKTILVKDTVNYIGGYRELKYFYPNETVKKEHIENMRQDIYCRYSEDSPLYETLYNNFFKENCSIRVLMGVFYKEMNEFLED